MRAGFMESMPSTSLESSWESSSHTHYWGVQARTPQKESGSHCPRVILGGVSEGRGARGEGSGKREAGSGRRVAGTDNRKRAFHFPRSSSLAPRRSSASRLVFQLTCLPI